MTPASPTSRDRLASISAPRASAFPAALRHTKRVARLRSLIVYGVGGILAICAAIVAAQSFKFLPADFRFAGIGVKGSRITIESPKLTGYRKDGRPYELSARLGVQDLTKPDLFELEGVSARLDSAPGQMVALTATKGLYDNKIDRANLSEGVRIYDDKSYDLRLDTAILDLRANTLKSDRPGTLTMNCCDVAGKSVQLVQAERRVSFVGEVHSVFHGERDDDDDKPTAERADLK